MGNMHHTYKTEQENRDDDTMKIEEQYEEDIRLFQALSCMNPCDDKITMCERLIKDFGEFGDYENSEKNMKKCTKIIKQTKEYQIEQAYHKANRHMKQARTIQEYERAEQEFKDLGDYKESISLKDQCKRIERTIEKHLFLRARLLSIFVVLVLAVIVILQFPIGKYYSANAYMKLRFYHEAAKQYKALDDYKDSHVRWKECEYQYGLKLKKKGQYSKALKCFQHADSRKDSDELVVLMQKEVLREKSVGDKIKIGDCDWIILNKQEDQVLLIKKAMVKEIAFASQQGSTTWEDSYVRQYMNQDFLSERFSADEAANIINYHSPLNNDYISEDKLVLLSQEEAGLYENKQLKCGKDQWLRTPTSDGQKVMFLNTAGNLMVEGYAANSEEFSIRPVFWYSIQ